MKHYEVLHIYIEDDLHEKEVLTITDNYDEAIDAWMEAVRDFRMSVYINAIDEGYDPSRGFDTFIDTKWRTVEHRCGYMFAENEADGITCIIKITKVEV